MHVHDPAEMAAFATSARIHVTAVHAHCLAVAAQIERTRQALSAPAPERPRHLRAVECPPTAFS
jgi:hypothetical protein